MSMTIGSFVSNMVHSIPPLDYLQRLNIRLQEASSECDDQWWGALTCQFFENSASLLVSVNLEGKSEKFKIGRAFIPGYFRSFYDGGAVELCFVDHDLGTRESRKGDSVSIIGQGAVMNVRYATPELESVCISGTLSIAFSLNQLKRCSSWSLEIYDHSELYPNNVPRSVHMTRSGMTNSTINCLKLGAHEELVKARSSRQGAVNLNAKDSLRNYDVQEQPHERHQETDANRSMVAVSPGTSTAHSSSPEFYLKRLNERLQEASSECDNQWWDALVCEFFQDSASLKLSVRLQGRLQKFRIDRALIPKYFKSFYDDGAVELYFVHHALAAKKTRMANSISLYSQDTMMIARYATSDLKKVCTGGYLVLTFPSNESITSSGWNFKIEGHYEVSVSHSGDITRGGMTNSTIDCLRQRTHEGPAMESASGERTPGASERDDSQDHAVQKQPREKPLETASVEKKVPVKRKSHKRQESNSSKVFRVLEETAGSSGCITSPDSYYPSDNPTSLRRPHGQISASQPPFEQTMSQPGTSGQSILTTSQPESAPPNPAVCDAQGQDATSARDYGKRHHI